MHDYTMFFKCGGPIQSSARVENVGWGFSNLGIFGEIECIIFD